MTCQYESFELADLPKGIDEIREGRSAPQSLSNPVPIKITAKQERVFDMIAAAPKGILVTELAKLMPDITSASISYSVYRLREAGRVQAVDELTSGGGFAKRYFVPLAPRGQRWKGRGR